MGMDIATRYAAKHNNYPQKTTKASFLLCLSTLFLCSCTPSSDTTLEQILRAGEVRVLTYESTSTYYETPEGPAGFEYDLARAFADHLGVRLQLVVASRY